MEVLENASLTHCNTLRLESRARCLVAVDSPDTLREVLALARRRALALRVLGGGSNVVLREHIDALVLLMRLQGQELLQSSDQRVVVRVAAGVPWHAFVLDCHRRGWYGLENLALIPGTVGAAPLQNIGAYGVEIGEFVREVAAFDRASGDAVTLDHAAGRFAYRHSIFKGELAEQLVIGSVTLDIPIARAPRSDYPVLREKLQAIESPAAGDVLRAVIAIRQARLPDPAVLPNAGSFFKNPVIDEQQFARLRVRAPGVVHWPYQGAVKLAAAWLVDQAGWKAHRSGDAGVHANQALVLVNHAHARASDMLALAARIQASVSERFGVELELEPAVY